MRLGQLPCDTLLSFGFFRIAFGRSSVLLSSFFRFSFGAGAKGAKANAYLNAVIIITLFQALRKH